MIRLCKDEVKMCEGKQEDQLNPMVDCDDDFFKSKYNSNVIFFSFLPILKLEKNVI